MYNNIEYQGDLSDLGKALIFTALLQAVSHGQMGCLKTVNIKIFF